MARVSSLRSVVSVTMTCEGLRFCSGSDSQASKKAEEHRVSRKTDRVKRSIRLPPIDFQKLIYKIERRCNTYSSRFHFLQRATRNGSFRHQPFWASWRSSSLSGGGGGRLDGRSGCGIAPPLIDSSASSGRMPNQPKNT